MKFITLRVPKPFSTGPQFDKDGELVEGSWPAGLPYEGMKGWSNLGVPSKGLHLVEFVAEDDWPVHELPGGWRTTASYVWDMVSQQQYDEDGNPVGTPYLVEDKTNDADYMGHFPDDTVYSRHHTYLGWPKID